jgi:metal-dependent amidase/aminoacylase/carboxypeptidase family protein
MTGILRTFDEEDRTRLHEAIGSAARAVAQVHGCEAEVVVSRGAPVPVAALEHDPLEEELDHVLLRAKHLERDLRVLLRPALVRAGANCLTQRCRRRKR